MEYWRDGVSEKEPCTYEDFGDLNTRTFKLNNGLSTLVESLEAKRDRGGRIDLLAVKKSNEAYGQEVGPITPQLRYATTPGGFSP